MNKLLVLKRWQPSLSLSKDELRNIPVWVKLYNLPFEYWTSKGLSFVVSALGLNDPLKQREVRNLIKDENLSLCGLVETKVLEKNKDVILKTIDRSWKVECNYNFSSLGRIWVCWNPFDVTVLVVGSSEQVIHCRVSSVDSTWECMISIVYGDNCNVRREALWADLVARGVEWENSAWIVIGDFNAIKSSVESVGGSNS